MSNPSPTATYADFYASVTAIAYVLLSSNMGRATLFAIKRTTPIRKTIRANIALARLTRRCAAQRAKKGKSITIVVMRFRKSRE